MVAIRPERRFEFGHVVSTAGVRDTVSMDEIIPMIRRHLSCDWGEMCDEDKEVNEEALRDGYRLMSVYSAKDGTKVWIITEADRSVTTILLPDEY